MKSFDKELIVNKVNNELKDYSPIEKARYIYIELGKYFAYDDRYYTSDDENLKEDIVNKEVKEINSDKIVCSSISKLYNEILNDVGINSTVSIDQYKHRYNEIELDEKKYICDLTQDLSKIKKGFRTDNFMNELDQNGRRKLKKDVNEIIKKADDKIGYTIKIGDDFVYAESIIEMLRDELYEKGVELKKQGKTDKEILKEKVNFICKNMNYKDLYCMDKRDYFKELVKQCIMVKQVKDDNGNINWKPDKSILDNNFYYEQITCVESNKLDNDKKMNILFAFIDKENGEKNIYSVTDDDLKKLSNDEMDELKKRFNEEKSIDTLSDSKKDFYKAMLFGNLKEIKNKKIQLKINEVVDSVSEKVKNKIKIIPENIKQLINDNKITKTEIESVDDTINNVKDNSLNK